MKTIGGQLARATTLSTMLALVMFAVATFATFTILEQDEQTEPGGNEEEPREEVAVRLVLAMVIATPIAVVLGIAITRRAAARVSHRIDDVIARARAMDAVRLQPIPAESEFDELDALARGLNALFARVDRAHEAQRQFAADASHELRTPLAVVVSELEVTLRRPRTREEWERVAEVALGELRAMVQMIDALLETARGNLAIAAAPCVVSTVIRGVIDRWRPVARQGDVRLEQADSPGVAALDPRAMEIAIGNLVTNAIAHSPSGETVRVGSINHPTCLEVYVEDRGPGIAVHDHERIFDPFVRGQHAPSGGFGLGLSIARRIVVAHGGTLEVDEPSAGARLVIRLPTPKRT